MSSCVKSLYNIDGHGRIYIDIQFSHPREEGNVFPCRAVVDTGANRSGFTQKVVQALSLKSNEPPAPVLSASGQTIMRPYYAVLSIPQIGFSTKTIRMLGIGDKTGFDALLGMDILSQCTFNFENNIFTLCIK